ncbi:hypothetical protein IW261DRAFT_1499799 [Armillaria novae-zelandiae]|uniref:Uncharacterized protein n=1 Tax=Armillaria novae-zelandiae TaxID=153914 RepID=A0AA39NYK2_9AGAR|nr:hypothetical protein IW261DRAFT_1499799 [Armillaria novae-zelandiae]
MQLLACQREILWQDNHAVVSDRVRAWRNDIAFVPSHTPPIHPFDAHRRVFSFFFDEPYTPGEAPDDAPTLEALTREYDRWFLLTLLGKFRYENWKASRGGASSGATSTEADDWEDFLRSKRGDRTQHHRVGRDELTNHIYINMHPVSPSGLTTTMLGQSYPPPRSVPAQAYEVTSPTSQPPTPAFPVGSSGWV